MKNAYGAALLALLLSFAFRAQAQTDFRPGYIVRLSGDTVRGQVDYRGAARSALLCRFRPAPAGAVADFLPGQLRGYGFTGGRRHDARLLAWPDSTGNAGPVRPIFVEVLAAGPGTLYRGRDATSVDHYFFALASLPSTSPVPELVQRKELVQQNGRRGYNIQNLFRSKLTELMSNCPAVQARLVELPFTASALTAVTQQYNACVAPNTAGAATAVATKPKGPRLVFGVLAGGQVSRLNFEGDVFLAAGNFTSSARPVGGISLSSMLPMLNEKLSMRIEALVEQQVYDDVFTGGYGYQGGPFPATHRVNMRLSYLRVPVLLRYTFPKQLVHPFVQAGISYAYGLNIVHSVARGYANSSGTVEYSQETPFPSYQVGRVYTDEFGFVGSLGLHLPRLAGRALTAELRYERSTGILSAAGFVSTNNRLSALVGFQLTK